MVTSQPSSDGAFRRIYDDHYAAVLAYCLRRDQVPGVDHTLAWLYGTARKTPANLRRSRSRLRRLMTRMRFNPLTRTATPETAVIRQH